MQQQEAVSQAPPPPILPDPTNVQNSERLVGDGGNGGGKSEAQVPQTLPTGKPIPNLGRQVPAIGGTGLAIAAEQQRRAANKTAMTTRMKEWAKKLWQPLRWVLLVVAVFTVLALASVWNMKRAKTFSKAELSRIQSLLQYSAKSAQEAEKAERDDPLQALLHANYALCYLNACKHIVDTKTIESLLGTNAGELDAYLQDLQHRQLSRLYSK